jgi:acyl transferase domain-containing protein
LSAADGRCKTLDAAADGYVRAEAAGLLMLQLLSACSESGRSPYDGHLLGVIAGAAVNQDGRSSALTAPNGPAQQAVINSALATGGVENWQVDMLQMHGTGTSLGDPIEVGALSAVFDISHGNSAAAAAAGSVVDPSVALITSKATMGHAEPAAGVVGVLHALHAAQQEALPPLIHLRSINPFVESALSSAGRGGRFQLPRQLSGRTRTADAIQGAQGLSGLTTGISSFAFQVRGTGHLPLSLSVCLALMSASCCEATTLPVGT